MVEQEETRREVLDILCENGLVVGAEELEKILAMMEPVKIAKLLTQKFSDKCLSWEDIESVTGAYTTEASIVPTLLVAREIEQICAKPETEKMNKELKRKPEIPEPEKIMVFSVNDQKRLPPSAELYSKLFLDRYKQIKQIFVHANMKNITPIKTLRKLARRPTTERTDYTIVGIVNEAVRTKSGTATMLEVEDDSGERIKVHVPEKHAKYFIKDSVVAFRGSVSVRTEEDCFFASDVTFPDLPAIERRVNRSQKPCALVFISDIHVGSKTFLYHAWEKFTSWFHDGSEEAKKVKYIVVSGDLVDGIGIYPNQEEELEIDDIYDQYRELARLFSQIPEHIGIIAIPGNHDAVRQAEPQPAFPPEIQEILGGRVFCYSNPAYIKIEGVKILIYHGRSFDDLVEQAPNYLTYSKPVTLMKELLKLRHLAPTYGGKTPMAPLQHDALVIKDVPDIFVAGHVHTFGTEPYRGTLVVNASTWQSQTEFQRQSNITPMPARALYYELDTGKSKNLSFLS
ncbi:MAG: DNA-directed DNA polymerase II small subunit [Thermoplasmata archaeon]|nr:DNA-directed DNA polymerase II small subunit [Thermoplasmata archaeon]